MKKQGQSGRKTAPAPATIAPAGSDLAESSLAALTLLLVYAVLITRFDMRLLFSNTTLTGGDTASWYQVLATLKNDFLPHGRLFGFSQSNFFGYLEGQHYFVLPFLSAALLGFIFPLRVALKIATVAGGFALPATMFVAASSISGKKRAGAIASALSLLYLFNESYTMFGGNWLSTFAGEFCYSWAIAILPLFIASCVADARRHRKGVQSGILLGLIGLCHFFVFMPAFFLPFFSAFRLLPLLVRKRRARPRDQEAGKEEAETVLRMIATYLIAFLLMAFWLLPMATTRAWAQPISMIWRFSSLKDFAQQTLAWVWAPLAVVFAFVALRKNSPRDLRTFMAFVLYALAACAFLFYAAPGLGMPDIRFIPTALLVCLVAVAVLMERLFSLLGPSGKTARAKDGARPSRLESATPSVAAFALAAVVCAGAGIASRNAASWFAWNYSGYEAKPEWSVLAELGKKYRGAADDGRFLWEKQDQRDNKDFGSERGFENLWLFTGHPTSEGINYGSSMMARASTYLQSSYSPNPVDPEAERIYSKIDPESWPIRFSLLNARYIITNTQQIADLFAAQKSFALDSRMGKFTVFRYLGYPGHYVEALPAGAVSVVGTGAGGFKPDYYRFFRDYELYDFPFVSAAFADADMRKAAAANGGIWKNYDEYRNVRLAKAAVEGAQMPGAGVPAPAATAIASPRLAAASSIRNEHVDNFTIRFDTDAPGAPHYIKISYAPGWKSRGGEKIYPVSPGFMLITPKSGHVEIVYARSIWETAGMILTLLALPAALLFGMARPKRRLPWKAPLCFAFAVFAAAAVYLVLQTSAGYPALARDLYEARTLDVTKADQRDKALALVEPWATRDNLDRFDNKLVFDAYRIKALALLRQRKISEAREALDALKARYPHDRPLDSLPELR